MRWIGLTGGIASGKSTVTQEIKHQGYVVIDADELARRVVAPNSAGLTQVVQTFGQGVIGPDGQLDRKAMGQVVFSNPAKLSQLESILHPLIQAKVKEEKSQLEKRGEKIAFYDVPLLYEKNLAQQFDAVVVVSCSEALQRQRLKKRDGLSEEEVEKRLRAQMPLKEKVQKADFVIVNDGDLPALKGQVARLLQDLLAGAKKA